VLALAASTTYSGPTASFSSFGRDTAVEPNGGRSFTAALALATGLSGGGIICACLYLDPQSKSYGFGYSSFLVPGRTHPCPGGEHLRHRLGSVAESAPGRHSVRPRPQHQEWGSSPSSACLGRSCSNTHTYTQQACPCRPWDLRSCPGAAISAPSVPGIGGPSRSLRLRPMATTPVMWRR
jgi:hypothetical protein